MVAINDSCYFWSLSPSSLSFFFLPTSIALSSYRSLPTSLSLSLSLHLPSRLPCLPTSLTYLLYHLPSPFLNSFASFIKYPSIASRLLVTFFSTTLNLSSFPISPLPLLYSLPPLSLCIPNIWSVWTVCIIRMQFIWVLKRFQTRAHTHTHTHTHTCVCVRSNSIAHSHTLKSLSITHYIYIYIYIYTHTRTHTNVV